MTNTSHSGFFLRSKNGRRISYSPFSIPFTALSFAAKQGSAGNISTLNPMTRKNDRHTTASSSSKMLWQAGKRCPQNYERMRRLWERTLHSMMHKPVSEESCKQVHLGLIRGAKNLRRMLITNIPLLGCMTPKLSSRHREIQVQSYCSLQRYVSHFRDL